MPVISLAWSAISSVWSLNSVTFLLVTFEPSVAYFATGMGTSERPKKKRSEFRRFLKLTF